MGKGVKKQDKNSSYVAGNSEDPIYFGAQKVIDAELKLISKRKGKEITETNNLAGLALSGGGIRSASFSLGIMQALAYKNWLSKIDYLSTVSGGGYIGTSLTWLLSKKWKLKDGSPIPFDTSPKNFPYVTYPMCGKEYGKQADVSLPGVSLVKWIEDSISKDVRGKLLHYLRQNAQYLTPGGGINIFSLIAVLLRGIALGLVTYFALCVLLFLFLNKFKFLCVPPDLNCFLLIASLVLATYLVTLPLYSLGTYFFRRTKNRAYLMRRGYEKLAGFLLPLALALAVVGSIPFISGWLDKSLNSDTLKRIYSSITGTDIQATGVSVISIIIGVISSIAAFFKTNKVKASKIPIGLFAGVGAAALLFGILILAYQASLAILVIPILFPVNVAAILSFLVVILALVVNLNHVSVHRYYRDRLMETFMPDVASILADNYERSHKTEEANAKRLHEMCGNEGNTKYSGPYHIINTNVVLASAKRAKFRGRGGDNFIMSPLYCGGNATGWLKTEKYMGGEMTLASAMAISGAAVNPDAGGGGDGITRQPFLSILMGMLNLRLGYWVPNPDPQKSKGMLKPPVPNYFWPGLWEIIFRYRLNEKAYFLQLTDGGHFENLALYEMIRRRLKLIIVCDGAVDPQYTFSELANAMQKVRTDFGALIIINNEDLKDLTPSQEINQVKVAKKGFLKAKIVYADNSKGILIYINTTFCEGLSADLYGYKREHPSFPEEPTSDQFFNEKQFEAYRELGYHIAWTMMKDDEVISDPIVKEVMDI
ncbi:MAG: patatin-like phospholipase family protein [Smithella sp.]